MTMSDEAKAAKAAYQREYRRTHKQNYNAYNRAWRAKNRDKVAQYNNNYWEKRATTEAPGAMKSISEMERFICDACILQGNTSISNKILTDVYNAWSNRDISTTKFSLQFKDTALKLGLTQKRDKHGTIWEGVTIKTQLTSTYIKLHQ